MASQETSRDRILGRIRNGLKQAALPQPFPEVANTSLKDLYHQPDMLPEEAFAHEFIRLGGKFVFCEHAGDLISNLTLLAEDRGWEQMFCTEERWLELFKNADLDMIVPADPEQGEVSVCITGAEYLIARTGSFLLTSRQPLGRIGSVYYPVHIVIAAASQVVPDIDAALSNVRKRYKDNLPSMINLNTGPSRTADIEKTLVVGVHGPGEVFCFLLND